MKGFLLCVVVFCTFAVTAYGIKCYQCEGTEDTCSKDKLEEDYSKQKTCPSQYNQCIRAWLKTDDKTTIVKQCGNEADCNKFQDFCDQNNEDKCGVGCCAADLCNVGSPVSFSVLLLAVCSALGLALLK